MLWPDALRRHQQLWQIDGPVSWLCCVSERYTLDPIQVLPYENRNPLNLMMLQDRLDVLKDDCCCVERASCKSTPGKAFPCRCMQRFPHLPHRKDTTRSSIPAMQDHGLGNVLLAALAPSLAFGVSAAPQPKLR